MSRKTIRKWRIILVVTDEPDLNDPEDGFFTKAELKRDLIKELPAGLKVEVRSMDREDI